METINGYGTEDTETIKSKVSNWIADLKTAVASRYGTDENTVMRKMAFTMKAAGYAG